MSKTKQRKLSTRTKPTELANVCIDPRAGSSKLIGPAEGIFSSSVEIDSENHLHSGDVAWSGPGPKSKTLRYGVEVKHLSDALDCMQNGRLVSEARKMQKEYDVRWILIIDRIRAGYGGRLEVYGYAGKRIRRWKLPHPGGRRNEIRYTDFVEWLTTFEIQAGFSVMVVDDVAQAVEWIHAKYLWSQKPWKSHDSLHVFDTSRPAPRSRGGVRFIGAPSRVMRVAFVMGDGMGWHKARAAGRIFNTPREFAGATEKQLQQVKGIGKKLAARIIAAWDEPARTRKRGRK